MPIKRGNKQPPRPIGDPNEPDGFWIWSQRFLQWLQTRNYSAHTVESREVGLRRFVQWCEARNLYRPSQLTKPMLERYQRHLYLLRRPDGGPQMSFRTQHMMLTTVRRFFRWMVQQNALPSNPASELELPRLPQRLPRDVLSEKEVEEVLAQVNTATALGVRDRAILELMYSTGIRRSELTALRLSDLDVERGTLMVREGKGQRDRMLPVGQRALGWAKRYIRDVRPELVVMPDPGALFLTNMGEPLLPPGLSQNIRRYVRRAGKQGACHVFRHAMATHMLEGGADVRYIQEMLGHSSLESTQVYTQVSIRKLKAIHAATHPTAQPERPLAKTGPRDPSRPPRASQTATAEKSSSPLVVKQRREDSE